MNNFRKFILNSKSIMALAIPIFGAQIAQSAMSATDTIMSGKYAVDDLAAIGVATGLYLPLVLLLLGTLIAVIPIAAQAFSSNKQDHILGLPQSAITVGLMMSVPTAIILYNNSYILDYIGVNQDIIIIAEKYLRVLIFGLPAIIIFQVLRGLCEALNKPMPVLAISVAGLILNIPLNYILIYGKFGIDPMGAVGSGYATMVCQWFMTVGLALYIKYSKLDYIKNMFNKIKKPERKQIVDIIKIGTPIGASLFISCSVFTTVALMIGDMGSTVVAGHMVAMNFAGLVFIIPLSISMAITVRVAYSFSENNTTKIINVARLGLVFSTMVSILCSATLFIFSGDIVKLYSDHTEVQLMAIALLKLASIYHMADSIQVNTAGVLRAYKDTVSLFIIAILSFWIVGIGSGWVMARKFELGVFGFWYGLIAGLTLAAILTVSRMFYIQLIIHKKHC